MRVLIATTGNEGHFGPLVGLARALAAAGDQVRVAAPASFARSVTDAGFTHLPFADPPAARIGPVMAQLPALSFAEADATVVREVFVRIDAQAALPGILAAVRRWRPDVLVREPAEFGSIAAAERAGVPHLQVAIGMTEVSRRLGELAAEPLAELGRLAGLDDETLAPAAATEPILSPVPELLDREGDQAFDDSTVALRFRDDAPPASSEPLPSWGDPAAPLVYVTFGSVAGSLPPFAGVFRTALDGLADLPARVFMTVGRRVDVAALGPRPANVKVVPWWPQADALGQARAVWGHGGFGTTMGALAAGVPQVVTPLFTSDQVVNARHVAAVGAGLAFGPDPDAFAHAVAALPRLLDDPALRSGARAMADAVAALAAPAEAASTVRAFARGEQESH